MRFFGYVLCGVLAFASMPLRADIVFYRIPKLSPPMVVMLQGRAKVLPGGTVSFRHPTFRDAKLIFALENVDIRTTLGPQELFRRKLQKASNAKSAAQVMDVALWALQHGLLEQYYEAVAKAIELDPQNALAQRVLALRKRIDQPVQITAEHKAYMRKIVPVSGMRFETSEHFLLMCDTPTKPGPHHKLARHEERLQLLEQVYRCFLYRFVPYGAPAHIPAAPLMVVLFNDEADFREYSNSLSTELASAAGFWDSKSNVSFFYDHGTTAEYKELRNFSAGLQRQKERYIRDRANYAKGEVAKFVRMANTLALLVEIAQENSDIEVVSHEVTHQMAGNTGLLPRNVRIPTWVHEGLATYFEAPKDATWSGIGAVNKTRLRWYRGLADDRVHSNIDFIVGDKIFDLAATGGATLHAYGQAWGLTHFLMNRHFDQLMQFYRRLGEMPSDFMLTPRVLNRLFSEVFGDDRSALDFQWRSYMRSLKTDVEKYLEEAGI